MMPRPGRIGASDRKRHARGHRATQIRNHSLVDDLLRLESLAWHEPTSGNVPGADIQLGPVPERKATATIFRGSQAANESLGNKHREAVMVGQLLGIPLKKRRGSAPHIDNDVVHPPSQTVYGQVSGIRRALVLQAA